MINNDKDLDRVAALAHLRDEHDLAAAHLLAADEPDAWLVIPDSEEALTAALAAHVDPTEVAAARELFAPLAPEAQARIVDSVIARYLQSTAPAPAEPTPINRTRARTRARWLAGLTAAAAAAVALLIIDGDAPTDASLTGVVNISAVVRGDPARTTSGEKFYLDCHSAGREITVVGVRAVPTAPIDGDASPRLLGGERVTLTADGATLHLRADVPAGTWEVSCEVLERASGRLMTLGPPAMLVVR